MLIQLGHVDESLVATVRARPGRLATRPLRVLPQQILFLSRCTHPPRKRLVWSEWSASAIVRCTQPTTTVISAGRSAAKKRLGLGAGSTRPNSRSSTRTTGRAQPVISSPDATVYLGSPHGSTPAPGFSWPSSAGVADCCACSPLPPVLLVRAICSASVEHASMAHGHCLLTAVLAYLST